METLRYLISLFLSMELGLNCKEAASSRIDWSKIEDLTTIKWAHGVNSLARLQEALAGDAMFLEADISFGKVNEDPHNDMYPIMAHSESDASDISLSSWLKNFFLHNKYNKGIKLDFKKIKAVPQSKEILLKETQNLTDTPVWINADILPEIGGSRKNPVEADAFINYWKDFALNFTYSLGWTTHWDESVDLNNHGYTWDIVIRMYQILKDNGILDRQITFPVRAVYCGSKSMPPLLWLMTVVPKSTLTVWGHGKEKDFQVNPMKTLFQTIPHTRLYVDVPETFIPKVETTSMVLLEPNKSKSITFRQTNDSAYFSGTFETFGGNKTKVTINDQLRKKENVSIPLFSLNLSNNGEMSLISGESATNSLSSCQKCLNPCFRVEIKLYFSKKKVEAIVQMSSGSRGGKFSVNDRKSSQSSSLVSFELPPGYLNFDHILEFSTNSPPVAIYNVKINEQ